MSSPAAWFHNAVVDGLQLLYALNLPDRPAAEVLPLTAITWVEVLWTTRPWNEALDAGRLPAAFRAVAAVAERWPAPKLLAQHLPPRRGVAALPPAAPNGPTPEQRAKLDAVMAPLRKRAGHSVKGPGYPLTRGNFPAAHEDAEEPARGHAGGLELS